MKNGATEQSNFRDYRLLRIADAPRRIHVEVVTSSGAPAGVSVSFSPASVTSGGSSTMTIATTAAAAPGSYTITVTGTNDTPVITTSAQKIAFSGGTSVAGGPLTSHDPTSGTLAFQDVDLTDTHTVSAVLSSACNSARARWHSSIPSCMSAPQRQP